MREHEAHEYRERIKKLEEENRQLHDIAGSYSKQIATLQATVTGLRKELDEAMDKLEDLEGI